MRLDHATGDGQPKAGSGVIRAALELTSPTDLEDPRQVVVADTSAPVGHGESRPAVGRPLRADQDLPVLTGVPDGVADKIGQGAGKLVSTALHSKPIGIVGQLQDELDIAPSRMLASLPHDVIDQLDEAQRAASLWWPGRSGIEP